MVIFSAVKLKELFEKERSYLWEKPGNAHAVTTADYEGMVLPQLSLIGKRSQGTAPASLAMT